MGRRKGRILCIVGLRKSFISALVL
jgi:hypothetical protein